MQELKHNDYTEKFDLEALTKEVLEKRGIKLDPVTVTVVENYDNNTIELQYDGGGIVVTLAGAVALAMRLHQAVARIRKADHNHPKNRR